MVDSVGTEGDSTAGPEGEEGVESSEGDSKPPVKLMEQISHSAISSNLAMHLSYTKRKTKIFLGTAVLTIWQKTAQRISARSPEK